MRVRMLADMVVPGGRVAAGEVVDVSDDFAEYMIGFGWAEADDTPPVELAIQTPQEHAVALRQRRGGAL